jgi:hypothetical protein
MAGMDRVLIVGLLLAKMLVLRVCHGRFVVGRHLCLKKGMLMLYISTIHKNLVYDERLPLRKCGWGPNMQASVQPTKSPSPVSPLARHCIIYTRIPLVGNDRFSREVMS